jgi:hypothetical protein
MSGGFWGFKMRMLMTLAGAATLLATAIVVAPAGAADMGNFTKTCSGSPVLLGMFAKVGDKAQGDVDTLCTSVGGAVAPKASQAQADILAASVTGTMTAAQKDAYENDGVTADIGSNALNGCLTSTGLDKDYGG